jgi:hypothetical protein
VQGLMYFGLDGCVLARCRVRWVSWDLPWVDYGFHCEGKSLELCVSNGFGLYNFCRGFEQLLSQWL